MLQASGSLLPSSPELLLFGAQVELNAHNRETHKRFSDKLAFTLNNRIRRFLEPPDQLILKLGLRESDVVMDFGCGPGFYTIPLAKTVAKTIAVDVSSRMLEKTASYARKSGVTIELVNSDGTKIKVGDESVDLILLHHVFHEITDKPIVLSEFLRIMKRSGRLVIVERTQGGLLAGILGPPVIDQMEITRELERAGFTSPRRIAHRNDSIIVVQKR